jgi:biopolymer transport protein ExbD
MRRRGRKKARIEIIPMIDIMLFLLIFFVMITLHMIPDSGMKFNLPKSSTANKILPPKLLITLSKTGQIFVQKTLYTPQGLTELLKTHYNAKTIVTIAGAKQANLQNLMTVMDACRKANVTHIGLAARN